MNPVNPLQKDEAGKRAGDEAPPCAYDARSLRISSAKTHKARLIFTF